MQTNHHLLEKMARAFTQAAVARGGSYKAQPTRCDVCGAVLTTEERAEAAMQPDCYRNCFRCQEGV